MKRRYWAIPCLLALTAISVVWRYPHRGDARTSTSTAPAVPSARALVPLDVAETAYDGKLGRGWEGWGWESGSDGAGALPVRVVFSGFASIQLLNTGLGLHYGGVAFRYKAPASWPEFLSVTLKPSSGGHMKLPEVRVESRHVATLADGWREVLIPWAELDPSDVPIGGLSIAAHDIVPSDRVLVDKIVLLRPSSATQPTGTPARDVLLSVECTAATHEISPLIYGASGEDPSAGASAERVGGNAMTRLNWDLGNTWNAGSDWFFENIQQRESGLWDWLDTGVSRSIQTALTVPMIGWVAKDGTSVGFPAAKFGIQRRHDENRARAGDGFSPDGKPLAPGPATETSVPAPPEVISRWITRLRDRDREKGRRSVLMYLLDNEPSLWNVTHRDVHPQAVSYDELLERTIQYASAIRAADPEAVIAGPTEWGWTGYFYSGKDRESGTLLHSDRLVHGNVALIPWYLQRLAAYEKTNGKRLLDVLDVHFYPAATGVYGTGARTDAEGAALRLRSTRALWDPTYRDESWINVPVSLIPRLKGWVAENYPGLKVSLGEWSFGADDHISGALATVEALGRFGQQGLDSAFYWGGPKAGTKTLAAFQAFRNFDGNGSQFLNVSLKTREEEKVSLFASRNDTADRIVAIVVNRDAIFSVNAQILLDACGSRFVHRVWSYDATSKSLHEVAATADSDRSIAVSLPPYSFAVLDISVRNGR